MPNFEDFLDTFKSDLIDLTKEFGDDVKDEIIADGKAFAEEARKDLEEWTQKLAAGELSQEDVKWLIQGKKDLAQMEALKQKGLAKAKIDKYRNAMLETVVGSISELVK